MLICCHNNIREFKKVKKSNIFLTYHFYLTIFEAQLTQRVFVPLSFFHYSVMMTDITELFDHYIRTNPSVPEAEAEFKRAVAEDAELKQLYRDWCHETGSSTKNGFRDYCDELIDEQNEVWDTLTDLDNE